MDELIEVLLTNAAMALLMAAAIAPLATLPAIKRRPGVCYGLWMLVLIKLVSPPMFEVPVIRAPEQAPRTEHASPSEARRSTGNATVGSQLATAAIQAAQPISFDWKPWLVGLSACGTLLLLGATGIQAVQLNRALRNGETTDPRMLRVAREAADVIGLMNAPAVSVVSGRIPPLLWFWRHTPLVVVPRALADTLPDAQLRNVLAHEYVHFARRDHWLAAASFVVAAVVWWNPIAWWARRELRSLQEVLCDAQVLKRSPDSRSAYARTLLKTLDFLQGEPAPLLPLATGFGSKSFTRKRFDMIASTQVSPQLSKTGFLALCCGFVFLACTPAWAEDDSITLKKCPEKVQKTIQAQAAGGTVLEVEREEEASGVVYEAEVKIEGRIYEVLVSEQGKLLSKELDEDDEESEAEESEDEDSEHEDADDDDEDDDDDEHEEAVTMKQLPKAVRATLKREAKGGEIEEIERETEDGRVVYSAEVEYETEAGELVYELEIAANGVLLSKVLEEVEDADGLPPSN